MQYYQRRDRDTRKLVVATEGGAYDLTSAKPELRSVRDLARAASVTDLSLDDIARRNLDAASEVAGDRLEGEHLLPVGADEIWAAGVTYGISEEAREAESTMPEMYLNVYDAERPEIFFKATPSRTVGSVDAVGIRADSTWNVPEPELGVVLYGGEIVGYTVGNDVSSRSIEGENPLYLPQAKVYDRCCATGPCVSTDIEDPHALTLSMTIDRDDERVYSGETNTNEMVRECEELVSYFAVHNSVPELAVLLTGTSLVPPAEFSLAAGDEVRISIEGIGTLVNSVVTV